MFAMQYAFTLPADYDMGIIRRRIAENGHKTDGFPKLIFKAYLLSSQGETASENRYAPFYLWDSPEGMNGFLTHPGFQALARSFGWPVVRTWSIWAERRTSSLAQARYATRDVASIAPYTDLATHAEADTQAVEEAVARDALAAVAGFEPTAWMAVRFHLWADRPETMPGRDVYEVGHVSTAERAPSAG